MKRLFFFIILFFALPSFARAASNVYYSVGQNTTSHETGAGTVTVSGTTATFTVAQTATNMGVGDVIDYDSDNKKCYISGKTSTTVWSCTNATGGTPTAASNVAVNSVSHAFSSLSGALPSGAGGAKTLLGNSDLTAIDVVLNIPCYYDSGADTTAVTIDGWTTDATRYIKVYTPNNTATEVNQNQRHQGVWDDNKYSLTVNDDQALSIQNVLFYATIEGLQAKRTYTSVQYNYVVETNNYTTSIVKFDSCIFVAEGANSGLSFGGDADLTGYAYNCLSYGGSRAGFSASIETNSILYNCTSVKHTGTSGTGFYNINTCVNCIAADNAGTDFNSVTTVDHSASDDGTGTNPQTLDATNNYENEFVDYVNNDFHLVSDSVAINNGTTDPGSGLFSTDIDSQSRSGLNWDIGADEATFNGPFSVSAWVNPNSTPTSKAILGKAEEIRVTTDSSNHPLCQFKSQQTWQNAAVSSDTLVAGQWAQVSCVYDQANLKIYLNGVEKGSQALTVGVDNMTSNWKIGQDDSSGTTYANWSGLVDDFQFYNYARTVEEVQTDFSRGATASPHNASVGKPLTDYNFDEGFEATAHNGGTLQGASSGTLQPGSGGTNTSASQMWSLDGYMGKGVELDGTDDRVELPDAEY